MQEFYRGGLSEAPPERTVGSRTGQKEKSSHDTGIPEGLS